MGSHARSSRPVGTGVRFGRSMLMAGIIGGAVVASVTASGGGAAAPAAPAELTAIASKLSARMTTVMIESSEPVAYITSQPDPLTLLIDLRNVSAGVLAEPVAPIAPVIGVTVEEATAPDGATLARVRVTMDHAAVHRVHSSRNVIYVDVERSVDATVNGAIAPAAKVARTVGIAAPAAAPATTLQGVRALPNGSGIALRGNGTLTGSVGAATELPARIWVDLANISARGVPAVTAVNEGDVQRIRVATNSRSPLITRVVVDLAKQLAYSVEEVGDELRILFESAIGDATEPVPPQPPAITAAPAESRADRAPGGMPPDRTANTTAPSSQVGASGSDALAVLQPSNSGPASVSVNAQAIPTPTPDPRFKGTPVSLDFQGADLRAVLRTFAEISGLNIVIDPTINGSVDVSLRDVPWDQALDIILRANKLGYAVDGTVVRIAPVTVLAQEQEERRKFTEAQALAGDLRVLTVPLSYAKAADLVPILTRSALSARGEVQVDARTNTLIVRDLPDRLATAGDLVKALDRPQPQVEIEARIVQSTRDFARSIGVQWGINGRVDPALGNTTPLAFPNSGSLNGRLGTAPGATAPTGVNLGLGAPTSAIGIALGAVNGALNLDVALQALERTGRGRLLSTPRVSTQNNVEAEMTQGVEIPIQTIANNTVTVSFKPAALTLRVTPQITAANTVIMRVFLENASPDFSRSVNGIPPIDTQRAQTTVLVADGETTVIGGIYLSREQTTEGRVPMLHRIPLLGWLFKRDELSDESRELLIFITPRITRS